MQKENDSASEKGRNGLCMNVLLPGSLWPFLYHLLKPHDAPGQWKLQQMVCLQRIKASLASLGPVPPLELSTQSDPHKTSYSKSNH